MYTWHNIIETQPMAGKIISNSIKRNRVSHAYLLQGSRGTGKKTMATLLAMTLFCNDKTGIEPCQQCNTCNRILSGNHPDVHWVEADGASITKEQIVTLRKEFNYTGYEQDKKIYIISGAETLTVNAANRILKYLEEPDQETTAILLTDNGQAILNTIRSRCQIIDLQPLDESAFQYKLIELQEPLISESNARLLSALTNNINEAVTYHEEGKVYQIRDLVKDLIYTILSHYEERYLFIHQKWFPLLSEKGDQEKGLDVLLLVLRDMINYQIERVDNMYIFQDGDGLLNRAVHELSNEQLLRMTQSVLEAKQQLKQYIHPTLLMEQLVLKF